MQCIKKSKVALNYIRFEMRKLTINLNLDKLYKFQQRYKFNNGKIFKRLLISLYLASLSDMHNVRG